MTKKTTMKGIQKTAEANKIMYSLDMVMITPPDMAYLNQQLKSGKLLITRQSFLYQELQTEDGVLEVKHKTAGRFYGGGVHEFSWDEIYRNGRLIFRSKNLDFTYKYITRYLRSL